MNPVLYDIGTTRSGIIQLIEGVEDSCEGSHVCLLTEGYFMSKLSIYFTICLTCIWQLDQY